MGQFGHPSNTWFLGPRESTPQMASQLVQPFLQVCRIWTVQSYLPASRWRQCAPHVTRFLGPTRILNPNGISIGSLFLRTVSLYFTMDCPFSPHNCPFPQGDMDSLSKSPPESSTQMASQTDRQTTLLSR